MMTKSIENQHAKRKRAKRRSNKSQMSNWANEKRHFKQRWAYGIDMKRPQFRGVFNAYN